MKLRITNINEIKSGYGYKYRSWPIHMPGHDFHGDGSWIPDNLRGQEATFAIVGQDILNRSGGVLEWCYSKEDAQWLLRKMKAFPRQFRDLQIKTALEAENEGMNYL